MKEQFSDLRNSYHDIRRYDVDVFTVGSDWVGKFDYLKEYCKVVYLPRTEGVSSSEIRCFMKRVFPVPFWPVNAIFESGLITIRGM